MIPGSHLGHKINATTYAPQRKYYFFNKIPLVKSRVSALSDTPMEL